MADVIYRMIQTGGYFKLFQKIKKEVIWICDWKTRNEINMKNAFCGRRLAIKSLILGAANKWMRLDESNLTVDTMFAQLHRCTVGGIYRSETRSMSFNVLLFFFISM